jgi:hypothetical protein
VSAEHPEKKSRNGRRGMVARAGVRRDYPEVA